MPDQRFLELSCPHCDWSEVCNPTRVAEWLRTAERLRHDQAPEIEIIHEVLRGTAGQLACPDCNRIGLHVSDADDNEADWPEAPTCAGCGQPISAERLEAVPGVTRCATCQQSHESGEDNATPEFCPRCGALMELQLSRRAGLARYVMRCTGNPPCR